MKEIEVRAVISNAEEIQDRLRSMGFTEKKEFEQTDKMFDRPDASLFRSGRKIRIRLEEGRAELTYKGQFEGESDVSRRVELNIPIETAHIAMHEQFLAAVGYPFCFCIPKKRKKFAGSGVEIVFDTWPIIGCMMEIEGEEATVVRLAEAVAPGVVFRNYRLAELFANEEKRTGKSLSKLQEEYESKTGLQLGNIGLILN